MGFRIFGVLVFLLAGLGVRCNRAEIVLDEKRDFSSGQAEYNFTLSGGQGRYRIVATVEEEYALSGSYRLGVTLSTPSMQFKEAEVSQTVGDEAPATTGSGVVSRTIRSRTDRHTLLEFQSEKGSYRLAIYVVEKAQRVQLPSIMVRVEKF